MMMKKRTFTKDDKLKIIKAKDALQIESMDDGLRSGLWNAVNLYYYNHSSDYIHNSSYKSLFNNLWHNFFKLPLDTMDNWAGIVHSLNKK